ncbi:F0F1 ATP synthase subunit B [Stieleria sp. TO1_6]|uniref:F0F1 ATP synthase subunit B n=1 Tax=Stieleria tagensis TaxID=2956795 RepID=UPI00209A708D|nr:F0F1 ATP synthase subunit B [Stieleria tagensis]MCO8124807.1 F0F1 ATP synthase subunit B [Stieleria tagensis]
MSYLRFAVMAVAVTCVSVGPLVSFAPVSAADTETVADPDHSGAEQAGDVLHPEGEHAEHPLPPILSFDPGAAIVNLAIFLGVFLILAKFVWPVILGGLKAREDKIASDLAAAQAANQKAEVVLSEYQQKLADSAAEAQAILAEARRDAETSAGKIVDEAKADAKRQGERALADIETAKKVALSEIAAQTSSLAMGVAKQVVGRELKPEDHADLIRNALDQVPSKN